MGFKGKLTILSFCAIVALISSSVATTSDTEFNTSLDSFSRNLFAELVKSNGQQNIIVSPFSIQTCLAITRMGANGETAVALDKGLRFTGQTAESIADNYHTLLAKYQDGKTLSVANKVYVMKGRQLQNSYNEVLAKKFYSGSENIDFAAAQKSADTINTWVEAKTNQAIRELVSADTLSSDTRLLLLSAIYFKGNWQTPFPVEDTKEDDFYIDNENTVKVQMMQYTGKFEMIRNHTLGIKAVRLPYKDSGLSMFVFLPHARRSFTEMLDTLSGIQLSSLKNNFFETKGSVYLPKFKTEFDIELTETLKTLGMGQIFDNADFSKMLTSPEPLSVSKVIHKAFIEVTEAGTKAAAATGVVKTVRVPDTEFRMDRPFFYAIINEDFVPLFQGTITNF